MKLVKVLYISMFLTLLTAAKPVKDGHVGAELISEVKSVHPGKTFTVAVRLVMDEHWHTYWRNAGDAGMPTRIDWELPEGFEAGDIQWTMPEKIYFSDNAEYAYENEVLLMANIKTPEDINAKEVKLGANVNWLMCKEKCIPGSAEIALILPVSNEKPQINSKWASAFEKTGNELPVITDKLEFAASKDKSGVKLEINPTAGIVVNDSLQFYPYDGGIFCNGCEQKLTRKNNKLILEIPFSQYKVEDPDFLKGILVSEKGWDFENNRKSIEINVKIDKKFSETKNQ